MKKHQLSVLAALLCLGTGCVPGEVVVQQRPAPIPVEPVEVRPITQAEATFSVASEAKTKLRVRIRFPEDEKTFSAKLAQRLTNRVILSEAEVVLGEPSDMTLLITPEFELLDKSGDYYRIVCKQVAVSLSDSRKLYAEGVIEPEALPRKLGVQNAKDQYLNPVADKMASYLREQLGELSSKEIGVSILDFKLANVSEKVKSEDVAARVLQIAAILDDMPGVINYADIRQDVANASCSFRVVYMKEKFPAGLANVVNNALAKK